MAVEDRAAERLKGIAAALGCSVEAFYLPDHVAQDASMTLELLRLWSALTEPQARLRVLASAQHEAGLGAPVTADLAEAAE